jgi:diguanylate cyclase (GGDEF)-like protein
MGVMLLPLTMVSVGTIVVFERTLGSIHDVVEEASEELKVFWRLQLLLERANTALQDCIIEGVSLGACAGFRESSQSVDRAFQGAASAPFALPEERALLHAAWEQWQKAGDIGESVLATSDTGGAISLEIAALDGHRIRAAELLEQAHDLSEGEMNLSLISARGTRRGIFFLVVTVLVLGVAIAAAGATALARSILVPIVAFERGAERFANGDLDYRVPAPGPPELHRVAEAFNGMADTLAQSQAALAELSVRDGLTDLFNRRELLRRLVVEEERSRRYGDPLALLFLDVDTFKTVNDTYGHQVGDAVLRRFSRLITQAVRPTDVVGRYGGDELAIVLPQTGGSGARAMAERIRASLAMQWGFGAAEWLPRVTTSIGIATYPDDADSQEELIRAADDAVYAAKRAGGDQTRVAPGTSDP